MPNKIFPPVIVPVALTVPPVDKLPPVILPAAENKPVKVMLPMLASPTTVNKFAVESKVKLELASSSPKVLNCISVELPAALILPDILPITLPIKLVAVMLPVADKSLTPVMLPELKITTLPTNKLPAVIFPVAYTESNVSALLQILALLAPSVSTVLAMPEPRLGSASPKFKNWYLDEVKSS